MIPIIAAAIGGLIVGFFGGQMWESWHINQIMDMKKHGWENDHEHTN